MSWPQTASKFFNDSQKHQDNLDSICDILGRQYPKYQDPWGLDIDKSKKFFEIVSFLYHYYFRVKIHGKANFPKKQVMVVANHSGQIALDGLLLSMAFLTGPSRPILLRGMIEKFMVNVPFLGKVSQQMGHVLGDRHNCLYLLDKGESLLVFPEGVRGIAKSTEDFYNLKPFSKGFYRMALQKQVDILPISIVGAEEFYPLVHQSKLLAKLFNLPAFPITPTFPFLGLLGALPMPSPVDIYIGKAIPIRKDLSADVPDRFIHEEVYKIENAIKKGITKGLKKQRHLINAESIKSFFKGFEQ